MKYLYSILFISWLSAQATAQQTITISGSGGNTTTINLTNTQPAPDTTRYNRWASPHIIDTLPNRHTLFTLYTDVAQYFFFQANLGFEYNLGKHIALGANAGLVEPCLMFNQNPLSSLQYKNPGTVYQGYALRLFVKFYPGKFHKSYWALQGVFKNLSYKNTNFNDQYGTEFMNMYTMSETEKVWGVELLHGHELNHNNSHLNIDLFYGAGLHNKTRNYTVTNENTIIAPGYQDSQYTYVTPGNYQSVLTVITPVIGLKFGWNYLKHN